jgi:hypothetical protein
VPHEAREHLPGLNVEIGTPTHRSVEGTTHDHHDLGRRRVHRGRSRGPADPDPARRADPRGRPLPTVPSSPRRRPRHEAVWRSSSAPCCSGSASSARWPAHSPSDPPTGACLACGRAPAVGIAGPRPSMHRRPCRRHSFHRSRRSPYAPSSSRSSSQRSAASVGRGQPSERRCRRTERPHSPDPAPPETCVDAPVSSPRPALMPRSRGHQSEPVHAPDGRKRAERSHRTPPGPRAARPSTTPPAPMLPERMLVLPRGEHSRNSVAMRH